MFGIFNDMDCASINRFCATNSQFKNLLCDNENFWKQNLKYRGYGDLAVSAQTLADYKRICVTKEAPRKINRTITRRLGMQNVITNIPITSLKDVINVVRIDLRSDIGGNTVVFNIALTKPGYLYSYSDSGEFFKEERTFPVIVKDKMDNEITTQFKWMIQNIACDVNNQLYNAISYVQSQGDPFNMVPIYKMIDRAGNIPDIVKTYNTTEGDLLLDRDGYYYLF